MVFAGEAREHRPEPYEGSALPLSYQTEGTLTRGGSHHEGRRQKQPLRKQQRLKAPGGAARAWIISTQLLVQVLVTVDDALPALDLRLRREALAALARHFETRTAGLAFVAS